MKIIRMTALVLVLSLLLAGCTAPHKSPEFEIADGSISMPEITPAPTPEPLRKTPFLENVEYVGSVVYNPACVPSAFADSAEFSVPLYTMLVNALRAGEESVNLGALVVTEEQFYCVRDFLISRNTWGTLSDITLAEGTQITISYTEADVQARLDAVQRFDEAASLLLETVVKPGSTMLSDAIALYKYLAQNVQVDYEAADFGMHNVLMTQSVGTDTAFAYAYSFLLDQIGVRNEVVFSEDGSHAWNVLTIGGKTFHCDVQMEAGLNGGQALSCFGLSDAGVAQMNGWNTWTSENHDQITCPESLLPELEEAAYADVDDAGNAVYFDRMTGVDGVFRLNLINGEVLQVLSTDPDALAVLGDNVYYIDSGDSMLYRMRISDGDVLQMPEGVVMASMRRVGSEIRYIAADDPDQTENAISID